MKNNIHVLIVDGHCFFRKALSTLLQQHGFIVLACTDSGDAFVLAIKSMPLPDIAIVNYKTTNPSTLETIRCIHQQYPSVRIIVSSLFDTHLPMEIFNQYGVAGIYIKSKMDGEELITLLKKNVEK